MKRETLRHPKTIHLAALLDVDRPTALGYLTLLWDYTGEVAIQGNIGKWSNDVIAAACDWPRVADEFIDALVAARWLDTDRTHRLLIHDWADHRERWVAKKLTRRDLAILEPTGTCDDEPQTVDQRSDDGRPFASLSYPNRTEPNLSNPNQTSLRDVCPEPEEPAAEPPAHGPSDFEFPVKGKGKATWALMRSNLAEYREAFPDLDIDDEFRRAKVWCSTNAKKQKTAGGMLSFLTDWLGRSQNKGDGRAHAGARPQTDKGRPVTDEDLT